jgi:hypothetical protein
VQRPKATNQRQNAFHQRFTSIVTELDQGARNSQMFGLISVTARAFQRALTGNLHRQKRRAPTQNETPCRNKSRVFHIITHWDSTKTPGSLSPILCPNACPALRASQDITEMDFLGDVAWAFGPSMDMQAPKRSPVISRTTMPCQAFFQALDLRRRAHGTILGARWLASRRRGGNVEIARLGVLMCPSFCRRAISKRGGNVWKSRWSVAYPRPRPKADFSTRFHGASFPPRSKIKPGPQGGYPPGPQKHGSRTWVCSPTAGLPTMSVPVISSGSPPGAPGGRQSVVREQVLNHSSVLVDP